MITPEIADLIKAHWNDGVVFSFKRGLWEFWRTDDNTFVATRYKGYKSTEINAQREFQCSTPEEAFTIIDSVKYSGKAREIRL